MSPCTLAVCDTLVIHALTTVGKRIVKNNSRSLFPADGNWWDMHVIVSGTDQLVDKSLVDATHILTKLGAYLSPDDPDHVAKVVESYVRDLVITGKRHTTERLEERLEAHI